MKRDGRDREGGGQRAEKGRPSFDSPPRRGREGEGEPRWVFFCQSPPSGRGGGGAKGEGPSSRALQAPPPDPEGGKPPLPAAGPSLSSDSPSPLRARTLTTFRGGESLGPTRPPPLPGRWGVPGNLRAQWGRVSLGPRGQAGPGGAAGAWGGTGGDASLGGRGMPGPRKGEAGLPGWR